MNDKLYPEEPDDRQAARVKLQETMKALDDLWKQRGMTAVTDQQLRDAVHAVNEAGQDYAAMF